jgi:uncharacterized protein YodC (DUF2158 family)
MKAEFSNGVNAMARQAAKVINMPKTKSEQESEDHPNPELSFGIGDQVQLKSGSNPMTASKFFTDEYGCVTVEVYFRSKESYYGNPLERKTFPAAILKPHQE